MSTTFNVKKSKATLDFIRLFENLKQGNSDVKMEQRNEKLWFFWVEKQSTRGVEVSIEKNGYELRNTFLSNIADYQLSNKIMAGVIEQTDGTIYNEERKKLTTTNIYSEENILSNFKDDAKVLIIMLKKMQEMTIDGPVRETHFGPRISNTLESYSENIELLSIEVENIILNCQYLYPGGEGDNIMRVNNGEKDFFMKVISRQGDKVIGKYDYLLFYVAKNTPPIMITNQILNQNLPESWEMLDEYTVFAPELNKNHWNNLLKKVEKFDLFEQFNRK